MEHIRPLTFSELLDAAKEEELVVVLNKQNDVIYPYVKLIGGSGELMAEHGGKEFWADTYGDEWLAYEQLS